MVTQCTACLVWFKVTREQLHAAHGLVRCSACNTVFNALATLRHDMPEGGVLADHARRTLGGSRPGTLPEEDTVANRCEHTPESKAAAGPADEPEPEPDGAAGRQPDGDSGQRAESEPYMEPGAPGAYLGMPLPDEKSVEDADAAAESAASGAGTDERHEFVPDDPVDELALYLDAAMETGEKESSSGTGVGTGDLSPLSLSPSVGVESDVREDFVPMANDLAAQDDEAQGGLTEDGVPTHGIVWSALEDGTATGVEADLDTGAGLISDFAAAKNARRPRRGWALVLALGVLLLAGQMVYAQRGVLGRMLGLTHPGPVLGRYSIMGARLDQAQGQPNALVLDGALLNRADHAQRLPLIRVTLTDRYGQAVGARILSPRQYGANGKSSLGADKRLMFHVRLADPGASAVGFSLVLCKRHGPSVLCQDS